jgi:hypothetical protein
VLADDYEHVTGTYIFTDASAAIVAGVGNGGFWFLVVPVVLALAAFLTYRRAARRRR